MSQRPPVAMVCGMVAGVPWQGGATWAVLQYVLGLADLGFEVYLIEEVQPDLVKPAGSSFPRSEQARYFRHVCEGFGLQGRASLRLAGTHETVGLREDALASAAARAGILINIAGAWPLDGSFGRIPVRLYLDLDPGFTQLWSQAEGLDMRFAGHTHFATVGLALGTPGSPIPSTGHDWFPTLQPVVLKHWTPCEAAPGHGITTVANWRGYGSVEHNGVHYGQKAHSLRGFMELPSRTQEPLAMALAIHPEEPDLARLHCNGWHIIAPAGCAATPAAYQAFIRQSKAELGIAKSGYVVSRSGWFSDRSACYLASGRPVLAQDTGYSSFLPTGKGLLAFSDMDSLLGAIAALNADYAMHCREARAIAEERFASQKVLASLLAAVGVSC